MALVAEETKLVTIDEKPRPVEDLPEQARQLVRFYDDWKQKELDARSALLMAQTSMRALANEIAAIVKKAEDDAKAAEEAGAKGELEVAADEAAGDGETNA